MELNEVSEVIEDDEITTEKEKDLIIDVLRMTNQATNEKLRLLNLGLDKAMDKVNSNINYFLIGYAKRSRKSE